jgi:hypothetical protein
MDSWDKRSSIFWLWTLPGFQTIISSKTSMVDLVFYVYVLATFLSRFIFLGCSYLEFMQWVDGYKCIKILCHLIYLYLIPKKFRMQLWTDHHVCLNNTMAIYS